MNPIIGAVWKLIRGMFWKDSDGLNLAGKLLAGVAALAVALQVNNAFQRNVGRKDLAAKIEQKAKANAKTADDVRSKSLSGAGRVRDPHQRLD